TNYFTDSHIPQYEVVFNAQLSSSMNSVLKKHFDDFMKQSKASIIPVDTVVVSNLLQRYFQGNPPFSSTKKSEFPDAINLLALENWCNMKSEQMYVISLDNDLSNFCEGSSSLHYLNSIDSFLNLMTSNDEYRHSFVINLAEKYFEQIEEAISEEFPWLGFFIDNEDGYAENIVVHSVDLEEDVNVVELEEDNAILQFDVRVSFEAEVTYTDYENSVFDKEEGKYLIEKEVELEVETDVVIPASVQIGFNISDENHFKMINCIINENQDISFRLYEEDYY
ncbi:PIN domain-containing protein, partial [Paenibacillus larvae]